MYPVLVYRSDSINQEDVVSYNGLTKGFNLDDPNQTGSPMILLYMYMLPIFPMHGIKVGMTTCKPDETFWHAIRNRIKVQRNELALPSEEQIEKYGTKREVIYWGVCLDTNKDSFKDYQVHDEIRKKYSGIEEKDQEWFRNIGPDELISAFNSVRKKNIEKEIYEPRKEQWECINGTFDGVHKASNGQTSLMEFFSAHPKGERFLLNCKMRYGKSFTTYKYCEMAGINKILILTFVPAVESSWHDDLLHIKKDYQYITDAVLAKQDFSWDKVSSSFVMFLSLQNYLGKDSSGNEVKEKIKKLADQHFDLVILDEYHFGAWNQRTQSTINDEQELSADPEYLKNLKALSKEKVDIITRFNIKTDKTICLSGTPFKALAKGEFTDNNTFTYSYFDEQENKYPNSANNDFETIDSAYSQFPDMKICGYNMAKLFGTGIFTSFDFGSMQSDEKLFGRTFFSLNKFFSTKQEVNSSLPCTFVYEEDIKKWLDIVKGNSAVAGSTFPYTNPKLREACKHTLWLMPTIASCEAMANLLKEDEFFGKYQIINLSGRGIGSGQAAKDYLDEQIETANNTGKLGSIAITVNKLTIGVTVKPWASVFVLKDLTSPEQYFQAIFRIQTPSVKNGVVLKKEAFVFDFNIDRAAALMLKYAEDANASEKHVKLDISDLIVKYMPIYVEGDLTAPIAKDVLIDLAKFGDSTGIPLSRKIVDTSKTTRILDEETISEMLNDPKISDIIKHVFAHAKFSKPKSETRPQPPEEGFDTKAAKEGREKGYALGEQDYMQFHDLDDLHVQEEFDRVLTDYLKENCPDDLPDNLKTYYCNGFTKGYYAGVNVPIKKLNTGRDAGAKFAKEEILSTLGPNIHYDDRHSKAEIDNLINEYLNGTDHQFENIPKEYRVGMLDRKWYMDSFRKAARNALRKPLPKPEKGESIEDADNVLKHLLARLFEFLFISVYRETTFDEIFNNADPDVFLEAVGITKDEFTELNKYNIFQKDVLNNYIHEFFLNESLGDRLDMNDEEVKKNYRNSFDWFGYGIVKE